MIMLSCFPGSPFKFTVIDASHKWCAITLKVILKVRKVKFGTF